MTVEESAERIYGLLRQALSDNNQQRQQAEADLRNAEDSPDYFASLAMIAAASDADAESRIRWLAAVCGKNAVPRSWRRTVRKNGVTEDERVFVRETLLNALGEKHSTIATQLSVWVALIARCDFPSYWPSLIDDLCSAIQAQDSNVMLHAIVTLDMVLKQLASKRLMSDRKALNRVAPKVFRMLHHHFESHLQILVANQAPMDVLQSSFRVLVYCLKSFRRLLEYGCKTIDEFPEVPAVFTKIHQLPDLFLTAAVKGTDVQARLSHLVSKLVRSTQQHHPIGFQPYLLVFLEHYYNAILAFDFQRSADRVCFQGAVFIRSLLNSMSYDINVSTMNQFREMVNVGAQPPQGNSAEGCRYIILSFFTEDRVNALIRGMISRIFILSERELETWSNDPEALVREEELADWGTESLRHECEEIFKILLLREKNRVVPMIRDLTQSVPPDKPLLLDACYRAVGRTVYDMHGTVDFQVWLNDRLLNILRADCGNNLGQRIIQARTAWLVGQFVEQLTRDSRRVVTPLLVNLMSSPNSDRVIALTAAKALQMLVDDMGFISFDFSPHLELCIVSCFRLLCAAETASTKRELVNIVTTIISRTRARYVVPVVELIATSLPALWNPEHSQQNDSGLDVGFSGGRQEEESGDENALRSLLVMMLTTLFRKAGPSALQSPLMRKRVFEIIDFAVDMNKGKGGLYMLEDGCELWTVVTSSSEEYSMELAALFPRTIEILGIDFDNLKEVFHLMEEYALIGREQFMNQFGSNMLQILEKVLNVTKERGCLAAVDILELLLLLFPNEGVRFISNVLRVCLEKIVSNSESQVVTAAYLALLARACLVNIGDLETLVVQGNEAAAVALLDALISNVDSVYKLRRRKLVVFAICGLTSRYCSSGNIQERVPLVLNAITQVLAEEKSRPPIQHNSGFNDFLASFGEDGKDEEGASTSDEPLPGAQRRKALFEGDISRRTELRDACLDLLSSLRRTTSERYDTIIGATDSRVLEQLATYVHN
eukprot:GFKZ01013003.1.p1 GENE.GFKZ01013003.1~~GFKZ01013003.1.p1  ORF type:complete len:1004 (-),score=155.97 GFKZ01013003.1:241-3252(-)